jgi:large subunit ribosomal protein L28
MARVCQVTGKKPATGNRVSHSHRKSRRRWDVNLRNKRYWFEPEQRWVRLRVSAHGMKIIDKRGLATVIREMRARGEKI